MTIRLQCPSCNAVYRLAERPACSHVKCRKCTTRFPVDAEPNLGDDDHEIAAESGVSTRDLAPSASISAVNTASLRRTWRDRPAERFRVRPIHVAALLAAIACLLMTWYWDVGPGAPKH
ncbi:MAG: hypothetical protein U1F36_01430 [Planctomycetota bacterium]